MGVLLLSLQFLFSNSLLLFSKAKAVWEMKTWHLCGYLSHTPPSLPLFLLTSSSLLPLTSLSSPPALHPPLSYRVCNHLVTVCQSASEPTICPLGFRLGLHTFTYTHARMRAQTHTHSVYRRAQLSQAHSHHSMMTAVSPTYWHELSEGQWLT